MTIDLSNIVFSGGWCKHGIGEANYCDKCMEEARALGLNVQWHEGDIEQFKKAWQEMLNRKGAE